MKSLHQLCVPRDSVFDRNRRDTVQDLRDLATNRVDVAAFFEETFVTAGMRTLLSEALRRLAGKSERGVFKLTQAMGGGKTHNLIALGLLARHPEYRARLLGKDYAGGVDAVRVVAFSGRESDVKFGIWGEFARQVGKEAFFSDYYQPLRAPGKGAWESLLGGPPTLILIDELPPYLDNARAIEIGASNLANVTGTALANLFEAVGTGQLSNVCIVLTDLVGTYEAASEAIQKILKTVQGEAERHSLDLTPVQINSDEFYDILRTRLFKALPNDHDKAEVAQAYAQAVRDAKQMDITAQSPEQFGELVQRSYPFHPAIKDLYARFRENKGFQQTRALIRLMRIVAQGLWDSGLAQQRHLVAVHDIDLNDPEILSEIRQINPTLENAVSHDIAQAGGSVAEVMDKNLGGTDATDVCRLLFMASLANVPNAVVGLTLAEAVAYLCQPGRKLDRLRGEVLEPLSTAAWYLHAGRDGRMYFRNVENINAKLVSLARNYLRDQCVAEVRKRLAEMFKPKLGTCYQTVLALPQVDEIQPTSEKVVLVIAAPVEGAGLNPDLKGLWDQSPWRNRLAFLTGQKNTFESVLEAARRLKALDAIIQEFNDADVPETDPQRREADGMRDRYSTQFLSAAREAFTTLWYPTRQTEQDVLHNADFLMQWQGNEYSAEAQVIQVLKDKRKFEEEVATDAFRKKVELRLFTVQSMLWTEVKKRAAVQPGWQWHRTDALDRLKQDLVHKDIWRENGNYVDKGPHPKPVTDVQIQERNRDDTTGEVELRVLPVPGDTIYYDFGAAATKASRKLDGNTLKAKELEVSFLAVDSTGEHATGSPKTWKNRLTMRYSLSGAPRHYQVELFAAPAKDTSIRYTTDGSNPRNVGGVYSGRFACPAGARIVQAVAQNGLLESDILSITIPQPKDHVDGPPDRDVPPLDPMRPVTWKHEFLAPTTIEAYALIGRLGKHGAKARGPKVSVTGKAWGELVLAEIVELDAVGLQEAVELMRKMLPDGQVGIETPVIWFERGQGLLDWGQEAKLEIRPGEIYQDKA